MPKSDILIETEFACILKPQAKKGVIIWHRYGNAEDITTIRKEGLKSGLYMSQEGIDFGRSVQHPYIFFRAPFLCPKKINYKNYRTELKSLYGDIIGDKYYKYIKCIRVDPDKTYVFSSEIRAAFYGKEQIAEINKSKRTLTEYFQMIKTYKGYTCKNGMKPLWNLISGNMDYFPIRYQEQYPWNEYPLNKMSEILVDLPYMKNHFFVK
jgi:hypothetical protein